jgi:hypothetical protein
MGEMKLTGISEGDLAKLQAEAERLGLTLDAYARLQLAARTGRGATARAIRARQTKIARRESVELIRADRDAL